MSRASLLQETVSWMDTVDLALCLFIYEVCVGQRLREFHEPEADFTPRYRPPEREPARLLYGFIRITDHPPP